MKKAVLKAIKNSLKALSIEPPSYIEILSPKNESFGDIATPIAMTLSRRLKRKPIDIAEDIVKAIQKENVFKQIDVASPGFINFTFKEDFLYSLLRSLLKEKKSFLRQDVGKGKGVLIEFVSANPTGPLHLGHGRGAAFGNALANLLEAGGYTVQREYYINDAGRQVRLLGQSVFSRYKELLGIEYSFPEDGYRGEYVISIAQRLLNEVGSRYKSAGFDSAEDFFINFSLKIILKDINDDLNAFGIAFDTWQSEKELYEKGDVGRVLDYLSAQGHIYEKEGAEWFRATAFGDDKDRVVRKSDEYYTYLASDIAYHKKKIDAHFDELINIWGADHHGYIPRLKAIISALGYDKEKLRVLLVQMVTLLRGGFPLQMSKRTGEFVTLKEVIEEVGSDTTKFIFLTRRSDSHLEFDLEVVKKASSENPVYYVQYANARINSIFAHAKEKGLSPEKLGSADLKLLSALKELSLIKKLLHYPMVFEEAVLAHEPHRITFYLQELSAVFHHYYNKYRVISEDEALSYGRLALCEAIRIILNDGLEILGITAPERM